MRVFIAGLQLLLILIALGQKVITSGLRDSLGMLSSMLVLILLTLFVCDSAMSGDRLAGKWWCGKISAIQQW